MEINVIKCPNCNGDMQLNKSETVGTCSYCGTKVILSKAKDTDQTAADKRVNALEEMEKIKDHFKQAEKYYEEYDSNNIKAASLVNKNYNNYIKVVSILFIIFLILAMFIYICTMLHHTKTIIKISILMIIDGLCLAGILYYIYHTKKTNKQIISDIDERNKTLFNRIEMIYNMYPHCPLNIEDCNPVRTSQIYDIIKRGSAETIQEAVKLYKQNNK